MWLLRCAVHTYAQCGGEGGTCKSEGQCKDAAWTDVACLSYDSCTRINHWWWCAPDNGFALIVAAPSASPFAPRNGAVLTSCHI